MDVNNKAELFKIKAEQFKKEFKIVLFYILYIVFCFLVEYFSPSGAHAPGLSFFLFILLLPISILLFVYDCYLYFYKNKINSKSIYTHILFWISIIVILFALKHI